jgi:hypothetical protein
MDPALRHDFKDGVDRRVRHPAGWLSLHMGDIQVRSIIATARVHIEAVPFPFSIHDRYRAPAGHENSIAKKRRTSHLSCTAPTLAHKRSARISNCLHFRSAKEGESATVLNAYLRDSGDTLRTIPTLPPKYPGIDDYDFYRFRRHMDYKHDLNELYRASTAH